MSATLIQRLRQTAAQRERAVAEQENRHLMVVARISHADAVLMNEAADELERRADGWQPKVTEAMVEAAQKSLRENPVSHEHPDVIRAALQAAFAQVPS